MSKIQKRFPLGREDIFFGKSLTDFYQTFFMDRHAVTVAIASKKRIYYVLLGVDKKNHFIEIIEFSKPQVQRISLSSILIH